MRFSKFSSHPVIAYQESGIARTMAMTMRMVYSLHNKAMMLSLVAPSTFRMPISLVLSSTVYEERPNKPRQVIIIASRENTATTLPKRMGGGGGGGGGSSRKYALKGLPGKLTRYKSSMTAMVLS